MKKLMILMCMLLGMGSITACGRVQETVSSEFTPAEEAEAVIPETSAEMDIADKQIQIYEAISNEGNLTCNPVPLQEEAVSPEIEQEETIPPEIEHIEDKDAELIALVEAQMQAVKDNDFEAFKATFDIDFMVELYIAEGWEDDIDTLDEDMLNYFHNLCEDMPELQKLNTIQGCLTDWSIEDIDTAENYITAEYTAFIMDLSSMVEFEAYISGDKFIVLLDYLYECAPVPVQDLD